MKKVIYLVALLALISAGCIEKHTGETGEHDEDISLKLTAYSNEFELFAEADPFVAGKSSGILSHLSHLPDFRALENGSVTIRLIIDNKEVSQTLDKPTRKGIYKFDLKPETIGSGHLIYDININNNQYRLIVPGIRVYSDEDEADGAAKSLVPSQTNTVVFTKEQSWKIEYSTALPVIEPFGQVIKTSALVESSSYDEIIISAKTSGMVMFSEDPVTDGMDINAGQVLFTISGSGMADNNLSVRYQEAQSNYERTRLEYDRKKELAKDKIVSETELFAAKNEYDNAKAGYEMLNRNFSDGGQVVKSPMTGFIKHVLVTNGQYVEAGQPVVSVSKNKTLVLKADVQQKYAPVLASITDVSIRTVHDSRIYTLRELNGNVLSYGKSTNEGNYLIPVSIRVDNPGNFIPGSYVELFLKTITNEQALTVPNSALIEDQGNYFVFVQVNPELFEKREVSPGATDGLRTEIIQGLHSDERIITSGAIFVRLSQATGTLDAHSGHVH